VQRVPDQSVDRRRHPRQPPRHLFSEPRRRRRRGARSLAKCSRSYVRDGAPWGRPPRPLATTLGFSTGTVRKREISKPETALGFQLPASRSASCFRGLGGAGLREVGAHLGRHLVGASSGSTMRPRQRSVAQLHGTARWPAA
jgi:hypothetical protein